MGHVIYITGIMAILYPLALALLCFKGARRYLKKPDSAISLQRGGQRFSPLLIGAGLSCFALAQVVWLSHIISTHTLPQYPSLQQAIDFLMYPFFIGATLLLPARNLSAAARQRIFLDGLTIMVALATLCSYFLLMPLIMRGHGTPPAKIVGGLFLLCDLVWIFCLLLVTLRSGESLLRPTIVFLGLAAITLFITHIVHLYELLYIRYNEFSRANVGLVLCGVMLVGAARTTANRLSKSGSEERLAQDRELRFFARWKTLLPSTLVFIFTILALAVGLRGGEEAFPGQRTILYMGAFVVLVLMVLRQFLSIHEIDILQGRIWMRNRSLLLLNAKLQQQAITDPLTGLPNHRMLVEKLDAELRRVQAQSVPCSVIFLDIDHFKTINDRYGHLLGDMILSQFGRLIKSNVRASDIVGRWGGEEFVAILPGVYPDEAQTVAERLRQAVEQGVFANGRLRLTCSLGVATYPYDALECGKLIQRADRAMYAAKRLGRNQVRMASDPQVRAIDEQGEIPEHLEEGEIPEIVEALLKILERRDSTTCQHMRRVAALSMKLALALGLNQTEAHIINMGGLLHDLGKIALADSVLLKTGGLDEDEFEQVHQHPIVGARILAPLPMLQPVAAIVRAHHEWLDGSGYPDQLAGEAIPLGARIVAVTDTYDVITNNRVYRQARSTAEAVRELQRGAGSHFDPPIVEAFVRLLTSDSRSSRIDVA
jgi:two-component system cell cycle response regulator